MNMYEEGKRVSILTILLNIFLCVFKIISGILGCSSAMIADGIHTLSDVVTTFVVILGLKISSKKEDEEHPYGHEKFESIYGKIISSFLFLTGAMIFYKGVKNLFLGHYIKPKSIAIIASVISILVKEISYRYTIKIAKKIQSISMEVDAWHHRADALSSVGTFIGISGAKLGFTILDPITTIIVSLFIIKVAVTFYIKSVKELVDTSADNDTLSKIKKEVLKISGVENIYKLKSRCFGSKLYIDIEIYVDGKISVEDGHKIATRVHDHIENKFKNIKHCMVHVEPFYPSL